MYGCCVVTQAAVILSASVTFLSLPQLDDIPRLAGLLAIAVNRGFHNASWAWVKLATGVLVFEGGFVSVLGPLQRAAEQEPGAADAAALAATRGTIWVLLAIAAVNVVLGIWRPRFRRRPL